MNDGDYIMKKEIEMAFRPVSRINDRLPLNAGDLELTSNGMIEHIGNGRTRPYDKAHPFVK
jgi:hypothetical protein